MAKLNKGQRFACVPCGREAVVDVCGISETTLWCCGQPMRPKSKAAPGKKQK